MARKAGICGRGHGFYEGDHCPKCGKEEADSPVFAIQMPGDSRKQSAGDDWMDRRNQLALERDKKKILSGEKEAKVPPNRDKRFDPSWVNEKRLF